MKLISIYGDIYDINKEKENTPLYIQEALNNGFNVIILIEWINNSYYLTNNSNKINIESDFIKKNINELWINPINELTSIKLKEDFKEIKIIQDYKHLISFPDNHNNDNNDNNDNNKWICSSYIGWYKQKLNAKYHYGLTINGRLNCHHENLFPQIIKYLEENRDEWIDIHIAINDDKENKNRYLNDKYMKYPFIATFSCERFIIPEKYINYHHIQYDVVIRNVISNFYTMSLVSKQIQLFKKNYEYDLLIKYRPDIVSINLPPLKDFLNKPNNTISTPDYYLYGYNGYSLNDQIAIGKPEDIHIYLNVFSMIDKYLYEDNITLHPETLIHHHLTKNNINVNLFEYSYTLNEKRK
jgi:hypothetical protein